MKNPAHAQIARVAGRVGHRRQHRGRRTRPARRRPEQPTEPARDRPLGLPRHGATHRARRRTARGRLPGDLTTAGTIKTGHTDPSGFTGFGGLSVPGTTNPVRGPGHPARRLLPGHLHLQHHPRLEPRRPVRDPPARDTGTADSSSPAPPASAASTPATSSSPTPCWPRATPTPPPTRATADPCCTPTDNSPATPSPSGTPASPSSPSRPRTSSPSATTESRAAPTSPASPPPATWPGGSWRTGPTSTTAASPGAACS